MREHLGIHLTTIDAIHKNTSRKGEENEGKRTCLYYSKSLHSNNIGLYITNTSKKKRRQCKMNLWKKCTQRSDKYQRANPLFWSGAVEMSGSSICHFINISVYIFFVWHQLILLYGFLLLTISFPSTFFLFWICIILKLTKFYLNIENDKTFLCKNKWGKNLKLHAFKNTAK